MFVNTTIEERVALLEIQVTDLEENVADLDQDVNFPFDEQVIQDERLFSLEQTSLGILEELTVVDDELESELVTLIIVLNISLIQLESIFGFQTSFHLLPVGRLSNSDCSMESHHG